MMLRRISIFLALLLGAAMACGTHSAQSGSESHFICTTTSDCPAGQACIDGQCDLASQTPEGGGNGSDSEAGGNGPDSEAGGNGPDSEAGRGGLDSTATSVEAGTGSADGGDAGDSTASPDLADAQTCPPVDQFCQAGIPPMASEPSLACPRTWSDALDPRQWCTAPFLSYSIYQCSSRHIVNRGIGDYEEFYYFDSSTGALIGVAKYLTQSGQYSCLAGIAFPDLDFTGCTVEYPSCTTDAGPDAR